MTKKTMLGQLHSLSPGRVLAYAIRNYMAVCIVWLAGHTWAIM